MKSRGVVIALISLLAGWLTHVAIASSSVGLEALVTWSDPTVTADAAAGSRILRPGDRLGEGERIHLPDKTSASLLCSTDRRVDLTGQTSWDLTPQACAGGQAMEAGMFRSLTPLAGRYATSQGTTTRRRTVRSGAEQAILLSPRHSAVDLPRPVLVWRTLHDAGQLEAEYELIIREHRASFRFPVSDLTCAPDPRWGDLVVCSTPWPSGLPDLEPGQERYWQVGFRPTLTARPRLAPSPVPFRRLSAEASAKRQHAAGDLQEQPWHPAQRAVLEGHLLARWGMLPEALDAYRRASARGHGIGLDIAGLTVTRGDLLLEMGLVHLADEIYGEAFHMASQAPARPAVQAAASGGLGQCADLRKDYRSAEEQWLRAAALYTKAGLDTEADRAKASAQEAAAKLPKASS